MDTIGVTSSRKTRFSCFCAESPDALATTGGPTPQTDWRPSDTTPDLTKVMPREMLEAARDSVCGAFGVLPGLFAHDGQGPMVREAQRHLAAWVLTPISALIAEEASAKLGSGVSIDVVTPLGAHDVGAKSRSFSAIIESLARAKEGGLTPDDLEMAKTLTALNW
jgi:hypothetical protein